MIGRNLARPPLIGVWWWCEKCIYMYCQLPSISLLFCVLPVVFREVFCSSRWSSSTPYSLPNKLDKGALITVGLNDMSGVDEYAWSGVDDYALSGGSFCNRRECSVRTCHFSSNKPKIKPPTAQTRKTFLLVEIKIKQEQQSLVRHAKASMTSTIKSRNKTNRSRGTAKSQHGACRLLFSNIKLYIFRVTFWTLFFLPLHSTKMDDRTEV